MFKILYSNETNVDLQVTVNSNYYLQEFPFDNRLTEDDMKKTVISDFKIYYAKSTHVIC